MGITRDEKRRKNNACTYISPQFPLLFFLHCSALRSCTNWNIAFLYAFYFLMIWTLCIPEGWNGEGLCRTHESQRPIAVNCVRTRILCHRKFRFCAGDWFYKKAKESTSVQRESIIALLQLWNVNRLESVIFLQCLYPFDLNCYKTECWDRSY